jgi:hypothetical protein
VRHLSYANVVATLALFIALGGTSYAVLRVGSADVVDNSLRSKDIRNGTIRSRDVNNRGLRARDLRRNTLGSAVVKESALGVVPRATNADRVGGATADNLRVRCPTQTVAKAGVCIERSPRAPDGFLGAINQCDNAGRGLATMPELDRFARSNGPLPQSEWTSSVYQDPDNGANPADQLETVLVSGFGQVGYDRVNAAVQHAFRCVALPSN